MVQPDSGSWRSLRGSFVLRNEQLLLDVGCLLKLIGKCSIIVRTGFHLFTIIGLTEGSMLQKGAFIEDDLRTPSGVCRPHESVNP